MKQLVVVTSAMALTSILTGCMSLPIRDSTEFTESGRNYQFQMTKSTMLYANASPLELNEGSETTRVLALFGMPDYEVMKPGDFSNFLFATSEMGLTQHYISPAVSKKPERTGPSNTDLAAVSVNALSGTGLSAGAVGAAGAALMIGGTDTSPDPRTRFGAAICYRAVSEQPDIRKAYVECIDIVAEDLAKAIGPNAAVKQSKDLVSIAGNVDTPAAGKQPVTMLVSHIYNHASEGYAPSDKGAFKAHVFSILIKRSGDFQASRATVADIGQALRTVKRQSTSYRLNGSEDYRKVKNAEPVAIY
ncbi:hypothetical protein [Metapseudomonas otitidis]|uniref:hypothetical protein n=1 Tax=Metapseudomonas otitidis TaxID=319939 RepID=UPI0013F5D426|nr:hypothetical protein [Pseudomonas otitidis]